MVKWKGAIKRRHCLQNALSTENILGVHDKPVSWTGLCCAIAGSVSLTSQVALKEDLLLSIHA